MKKIFILLAVMFVAGCVAKPIDVTVSPQVFEVAPPLINTNDVVPPEPMPVAPVPVVEPAVVDVPAVNDVVPPTPSPARTVNLKVPFTSQAPYQVWDEVHEETCEEASMIMVAKYLADETLTPHTAEQAMLSLLKWQEARGYQIDATAMETATILKDYFDISSELSSEVTIEGIKTALRVGHPIIIPAAGRLLGNPNFTGAGPIYHMLVIRGYDDATHEFITNDPGTRKGEGYRYDYDVLINAIHDWSHERAEGGMTDDEIVMGEKVMIVVSKN